MRPSRLIPCVLLAAPLAAGAAPWRDPSPHTVRYVTVGDGVRLEVLDWGGTGRSVVLLAGGGNTAHVFDDFAPKLSAHYRVYGITRRGFGGSAFAESPDPLEGLRDDVLSALDVLGVDGPVLAGHSVAGAEMSAIARSQPQRIAGLVYLDAAYPYAFDDGTGPTMAEFMAVEGPGQPTPAAADLRSFAALRDWLARVDGYRTPEAELRQTWEADGEAPTGRRRSSPGSQAFSSILADGRRDAGRVRALAIFALPHASERSIRKGADRAMRDRRRAYFTKIDALTERQARAFEAGVPTAHVVRIPGPHHIFLSNAEDVRRAMRAFIDGSQVR
ncbi:MAG: alpha/beta hydrolase [Vicinamibacteria bacterium]